MGYGLDQIGSTRINASLAVAVGAVLMFLPSVSNAAPILLDQAYSVSGNAKFLQGNHTDVSSEVQGGSTLHLGSNGILTLKLQTTGGSATLDFGFDLADYNDGGELRLAPAIEADAHAIIKQINEHGGYTPNLDINIDGHVVAGDALKIINALNSNYTDPSWWQIGLFDPLTSSDWASYSFIATMKDAVLQLDTDSHSLMISTGQFDSNRELLGYADFHLYTRGPECHDEVPEPATMTLLGLGLAGAAARKRRFRSA